MKEKYPEQPLSHLNEEQLDELLAEMGHPLTEKNQWGIQDKLQQKRQIRWFPTLKKRTKIMLVIAAAAVLFPTGALAANKIWEVVTKQEGFLTTLSLQMEEATEQPYKLSFDYLPAGLVPMPDTEGTKYWRKDTQQGGFSAQLIKPKEVSQFEVPYSQGVSEKTINGHKTYIVQRTGNNNSFNVITFTLFEKEQRVLQIYFDQSLSTAEQEKILAGAQLQPVKKAEATPVYDLNQVETADPQEKITPLQKDSQNFTNFDESFTGTVGVGEGNTKITIKPRVQKVTTQLPNYSAQRKTDYIGLVPDLAAADLISQDGKLQEFTTSRYLRGDGQKSIDTKQEELTVEPTYLEMTFDLQNSGEKDLSEFYFSPELVQMKENKNSYTYAPKISYFEPFDFWPELVYSDHHGAGKAYYNIGELKAGEEKTVTIGYVVINPENHPLLLRFNFNGAGEANLNADNYHWLKLDQ